jgi:hypothetical protein
MNLQGRRITVEQARQLSLEVGASILWCPNGLAPDEYCILFED